MNGILSRADAQWKLSPGASTGDTSTQFIASLLLLCRKSSISVTSNISESVKAILIICMKFINREELCKVVIPEHHIDWEFIMDNFPDSNTQHNPLGDILIWLAILDRVDFGELKLPDMLMKRTYPPLFDIYNSIKESRALDVDCRKRNIPVRDDPSAPRKLYFNDACKLVILSNLVGISCKNATDQFTSSRLKMQAYVLNSNIVTSMAENRYNEDVYFSTIQYLLGLMQVDESRIRGEIEHHRRTNESQKQVWRMKHLEIKKNRPSMRQVALRTAAADGNLGGVNGCDAASQTTLSQQQSGVTVVTFDNYNDLVRFPNSMTRLLRLRCYLLASLSHLFDFTSHSQKLVPMDVAKSLNENTILFPSAEVITNAIETMAMNMHPFQALNNFRQKCFNSFAMNHRKSLTLTQILHLYLCAYQKNDIWKTCWKGIFPVMSTQIARDIETFTGNNSFAVEEFMHILVTSNPF